MKLFLDDERQPKDVAIRLDNGIYMKEPWTVVKNFADFKNYLETNEIPELISFDHDLTYDHYRYAVMNYIPYSEFKDKTGYHCLLWLILFCHEKKVNLPKILIHTMNVEGKNNMMNLLDTYNSFIN
jgi:hypothetical protein